MCTYGLENDSAEWVLQQCRLGVHAAIVDDVAGVLASMAAQAAARQGLEPEEPETEPLAGGNKVLACAGPPGAAARGRF